MNVLRTPGRTLVGALSLAVGVTALTLLIAVTLAFRGAVVGTLLGNVVTVRVRGVDYVAVAATVILGVLAVADALLISITERARGVRDDPRVRLARGGAAPPGDHRGRPDRDRRLGHRRRARPGGRGHVHRAVPAAAVRLRGAAAAAGVLVTCVAALLPAHLLRRLPAAQLLAEE